MRTTQGIARPQEQEKALGSLVAMVRGGIGTRFEIIIPLGGEQTSLECEINSDPTKQLPDSGWTALSIYYPIGVSAIEARQAIEEHYGAPSEERPSDAFVYHYPDLSLHVTLKPESERKQGE